MVLEVVGVGYFLSLVVPEHLELLVLLQEKVVEWSLMVRRRRLGWRRRRRRRLAVHYWISPAAEWGSLSWFQGPPAELLSLAPLIPRGKNPNFGLESEGQKLA